MAPPNDGFTAPSGHARIPALGADFPEAVHRRDQETHAAIERSRRSLERLNPLSSLAEISARWMRDMCSPGDATDPEYAASLKFLRERVAPLHADELNTRLANPDLQELASGAEFDVYLDERHRSVYKVSRVHPFVPGVLRGGWMPGTLIVSDGRILFDKGELTSIFELIDRVRFGNGHRGVVYTEIGGVASDGRILLKQPLIDPAQPSEPSERVRLLPERSFKVLDRLEGLTAVALGHDGRAWCLGDLHENNALVVEQAGLFIVDYSARPLSDRELDVVESY